MRYVLSLVFLALAAACGFGLLASFEPGAGMMWKVGYGLGAGAFLCAAIASLMRRGDNSRS
ncbi:MAG TPA: hypothetical protein VMS30_10760 [Phycisphaerales bacterium]|jgi:hypothetical protein|nr:hypothetical protein [Phycisphaerales bacterium]